MLRVASTLVLGILTLLIGNAFAQPGGTTRGRAGGDFPAVGTTVPDVMLYDASGEEFSTTSLRGEYSVLVFGCLT